MEMLIVTGVVVALCAIAVLFVLANSIHKIGPTEMGLVIKNFDLSFSKSESKNSGDIISFDGKAGIQSELLGVGLHLRIWPIYKVEKYPLVQVPPGEIGVVISQIGESMDAGSKSAEYKKEFGNFTDLKAFIEFKGQKGIQRPVLPGGSVLAIHPAAFLVITSNRIYGKPVTKDLIKNKTLSCFGLESENLRTINISSDEIGIVKALDGLPLEKGDIACRLGGFDDIKTLESNGATAKELLSAVMLNKNNLHNNYQDFQKFIDNGGKMGLQHDPLLCGKYNLNPFLVSVERMKMLTINQGEVAVVKSAIGLESNDTSKDDFNFGAIVNPGHKGVWNEVLCTGKYPLNKHCYSVEIVPTSILNLNWANANSSAHSYDEQLQSINAKSSEGFEFKIDLQVQIHVKDIYAPQVISMVNSIKNLVDEILQASVGNHFRNVLQGMTAVEFISKRKDVQMEANKYIEEKLKDYNVETKGVYIQDVILPEELVKVLTEREIANQNISTFDKKREAEDKRVEMEASRGKADAQKELAQSQISVDVARNSAEKIKIEAEANKERRLAEAEAESEYIRKTGEVKGAEILSIGTARAESAKLLKEALGEQGTSMVNIVDAIMKGDKKIMPEILIMGGKDSGGANDGLAAMLTSMISKNISLNQIDSKNDNNDIKKDN